jgi:hypothetical protein
MGAGRHVRGCITDRGKLRAVMGKRCVGPGAVAGSCWRCACHMCRCSVWGQELRSPDLLIAEQRQPFSCVDRQRVVGVCIACCSGCSGCAVQLRVGVAPSDACAQECAAVCGCCVGMHVCVSGRRRQVRRCDWCTCLWPAVWVVRAPESTRAPRGSWPAWRVGPWVVATSQSASSAARTMLHCTPRTGGGSRRRSVPTHACMPAPCAAATKRAQLRAFCGVHRVVGCNQTTKLPRF